MARKNRVITVVGVEGTLKHLARYREAAEAAVEKAVVKAARIVIKESNKLCPIDTGYLRESATIDVEGEGLKTKAVVTYEAPYAIYVHENLEAWHEPPTQAKFLEETIRRYRKDIQTMIRNEVTEALRRARFWRAVRVGIERFVKDANRTFRSQLREEKRGIRRIKKAAKVTKKVSRRVGKVIKSFRRY